MTAVSDQVAAAGGQFDRLIKRDKVHGSLYTDPTIFADELHKIWYRSWVFVGHETEVAPTRRLRPKTPWAAGHHHDPRP